MHRYEINLLWYNPVVHRYEINEFKILFFSSEKTFSEIQFFDLCMIYVRFVGLRYREVRLFHVTKRFCHELKLRDLSMIMLVEHLIL